MWLVKRRDREINHAEGTEGEGIAIFLRTKNESHRDRRERRERIHKFI
jgi:hypothetical protein